MLRNQNKALLVGGLLVFAGFMLGRMSREGTAYAAQGAASEKLGVGLSIPENGAAVLFTGSNVLGGPSGYFINSRGEAKSLAPR